MRAHSIQLFMTLWTECSPPGSSVHGILQERTLEHWSGLPCLLHGSSRVSWIKPMSLALQADSLQLSHQGRPSENLLENNLEVNIKSHWETYTPPYVK